MFTFKGNEGLILSMGVLALMLALIVYRLIAGF
jgi:hypothetical protein